MSQYDTRTTAFSQEGRIYQLEYAAEAINSASVSFGFLTQQGVILAALKSNSSPLLDEALYRDKIYVVDARTLCCMAGWSADGSVLLQMARESAQDYFRTMNACMPTELLVSQICRVKHYYTQYNSLRPFGVSFLFAGYDDSNKLQLYLTDPAGNESSWNVIAIGQNNQTVQKIFGDYWKPDLTLEQGLDLACRILKTVSTDPDKNAVQAEIGVVCVQDGRAVHRLLPAQEVHALIAKAQMIDDQSYRKM
uniref:Proteasome subunit alpha type-4-like n=1 Tax=Dermatophagoides pteronyssinus TaxID=6956 RepID=A0A6P6Y9N4_DERPT|nr:proteasome subunit alpha type-4-like [Dermatophagoides pteronyssinus]